METSFLTQDEFFELMEPMFIEMSEKFGGGRRIKETPFPRIPYKQAMLEYGSDKPDLRFDMKIQDITELVKGCEFKVFAEAPVVRCLVAPGASEFTRSTIDELTEFAQSHGAKGLAYIVLEKGGGVKSPIVKFLGEDLVKKIIDQVGAEEGDIIFFGADKELAVAEVLGQVRVELAKRLNLIDESLIAWAWIVDFPMFEYDEKEKRVDFGHNPFSMPQGGMEKKM
jgi:aspartyl-tRNA synthetase